jgi:hypothetical protein
MSALAVIFSFHTWLNAEIYYVWPGPRTEIHFSHLSTQITILEAVILVGGIIMAAFTFYGFDRLRKDVLSEAREAADVAAKEVAGDVAKEEVRSYFRSVGGQGEMANLEDGIDKDVELPDDTKVNEEDES